MTDQIFTELYDEIFNPLTFDYEIDGVTYMAYSQSVPPTATERSQITFYLFLLVNKESTRANQVTVEGNVQSSLIFCFYLVLFTLITALCISLLIAFLAGWRITRSVRVMTIFTERMKQA